MNIYLTVCLTHAILLICMVLLYFGIQNFGKTTHFIEKKIDEKIPLVTQSVYIYVLWFPLIGLFPIAFFYYSVDTYLLFTHSLMITIIVSTLFYYLYPTTIHRPEIEGDSFSARVMRIVYKGDYKGKNCSPSMHCSVCYLIMYYAVICPSMSSQIKILVCMLCVGIVMSTVLTKQHALIDTVTALCLVAVVLACTGSDFSHLDSWRAWLFAR